LYFELERFAIVNSTVIWPFCPIGMNRAVTSPNNGEGAHP